MKILAEFKPIIKDAAKKLTGYKRRAFQAQTTLDLLDGNARQAEREFGWGRETVNKGLHELKSGLRCYDAYQARGNKPIEEKIPELADDIAAIVDPKSQAEPRFRTTLAYTRITAKAVRETLIAEKGYTNEELPCDRTIDNLLNRLGYRLRRVQKTKPVKKIPEVDEIFANVQQENERADADPHALRISMDVKAKLSIGFFSRGGKARGQQAKEAADHDMNPESKLVPCGILEVVAGLFHVFFNDSLETTDLIMDTLHRWWQTNQSRLSHIQELVINLDNGPHIQSHRTQLIKRMVMFADLTGLRIRLIYYPPYHSKYNAIEHAWGVLENHWNGTILDTIEKAIEWTKTMTWKGISPIVAFIKDKYEHGVKVEEKDLLPFLERFKRSKLLPKWDVTIDPQPG